MSANDLAKQVRAVLLHDWDPIGIADEPAAQDEYDSYAPGVVRLLLSGATSATIADHLIAIERDRMGLPGDLSAASRVATRLMALAQ